MGTRSRLADAQTHLQRLLASRSPEVMSLGDTTITVTIDDTGYLIGTPSEPMSRPILDRIIGSSDSVALARRIQIALAGVESCRADMAHDAYERW